MSNVFISYRRSDAGVEAGRLADALQPALGHDAVFRDVGSIDAGDHFDEALERALQRASHVIVLIGPGWLAELQRRMARAEVDFVRVEVARSLAAGKVVMPVLLRGSVLPSKADLPEDLADLPRHEAKPLRDDAWRYDVDRLLVGIGRPYRVGALALRCVAVLVAVAAMVSLAARSSNLDFSSTQRLFWGALAAYGGAEAVAYFRARRNRWRH